MDVGRSIALLSSKALGLHRSAPATG